MKKTAALISIALFALNTSYAQIGRPVKSEVNKTVKPLILKPVENKTPPPPPPPPSKNKSIIADNQITPVYSLTAVKANIRTGNDNKEYPSVVRTTLSVKGTRMEYAYFTQENLKNEMKSNSNTEFGLEKKGDNLKDINLTALQSTGFSFKINYTANFQFDAWKIEGVTVTLEFRDQNGNLHPAFGQKTVTFSNANGFLNGYDGNRTMICTTDGYFNPLSAYIQ